MGKRFEIFHHIDQSTIDLMFREYSPVFVLTTGRSGSKLIHQIFSSCPDIVSHHEAFPTLQYYSNFAYHNQYQLGVLKGMFLAARMEMILEIFNNRKIFCESNQCLTFYAEAILQIFPRAKFVHLIRHPGSFIRSAIQKGWHLNDSIWESGRIKMTDTHEWAKLSQIQKLAWVWHATNKYIYDFCISANKERCLIVKLEDILRIPDILESLLLFAGSKCILSLQQICELQETKINELLIHACEPSNMYKIRNYPVYEKWSDLEKESINEYLIELANIYGYEL